MRRRLRLALVGLTIAIVVLYAIPRVVYLAGYVRAHEQEHVERAASAFAEIVTLERAQGLTTSAERLDAHLVPDEWVTLTAPDGTVDASSDVEPVAGGVVASRTLPDGDVLTVGRSGSVVAAERRDALVPLVGTGLAILVGAFVVAELLARRFARPFQRLAVAAGALGTGDFAVDVPRSGVPEADAIGEALSRSGHDLAELVGRERALTVHASHALRTPLTAMRLQVDDLATRGDLPADVTAQLEEVRGEVDRLTRAVDDVLAFAKAREATGTADVDLGQALGDVVARWRARCASSGRTLTLGDTPDAVVHVAPGSFAQVLDAVVRHLHDRGSGRISVTARELGDLVQVRVADESGAADHADVFTHRPFGATSAGSPADDGPGPALLVARGMAEAMGARLTLDAEASTTFVLTIRRGEDRTA